ncbi:MAG: hypothetical protein Q8R69_11790 [Telluria sp.]|nr:hypothetical protein [Telluria sp.]
MKHAYQNICGLIALSGFSDREVMEFAERLFQQRPDTFMLDIGEIRRILKNASPNQFLDEPVDRKVQSMGDTAHKIERLLILEAGIPKAIAVMNLLEELKLRFPSLHFPSENRKGFYTWIRRLCTLIPEKELLHVATSIRNRSVHDTPSDWRLK